jgi:hypothetical protein
MDDRFCFIKNKSDSIVLAIRADENIIAGADFKLYDIERKEVLEEWKATIDNANPFVHRFSTKAKDLEKTRLSWQVAYCSRKSNLFRGSIELIVKQADTVLRTTKPLSYSISNIPPCGYGESQNFNGSMIFITDKDNI